MAKPPVLIELMPLQTVLEGADFPPLNCNEYIVAPDGESGDLHYSAKLISGAALPAGLTCSEDGEFGGKPNLGTHGRYDIQLIVKNDAETPLEVTFPLVIQQKVEAKPGELVWSTPVPPIVINEGAALGPIDLKDFVRVQDSASQELQFMAELTNGAALPRGIICTGNGILGGIPASGTSGYFEIHLVVTNPADGAQIESQFALTIKERIEMGGEQQFYTGLKTQIWDALGKNQPVPEFAELFNRELTAVEVYYLMQRFATLTVYDVYNLDAPGKPILLNLPDASPHYNVYDRGSCIVGAPKELFSHKRNTVDLLITAKAMAREVFKRNWTVELVGFQKMMRACWVEMQVLGEQKGRFLDVLHYNPTERDLKLIREELRASQNLSSSP